MNCKLFKLNLGYKNCSLLRWGFEQGHYLLYQNYPNPFNPNTIIRFALPKESKVELKIYSILGEEVATLIKNKVMGTGNHEIEFAASNIASGVYFYRIVADGFTDVNKMVLVK